MPQFWQEEIFSCCILPRTGLSVQNISHPHFLLICSAMLKTRSRENNFFHYLSEAGSERSYFPVSAAAGGTEII
jgi:hypothetical protein